MGQCPTAIDIGQQPLVSGIAIDSSAQRLYMPNFFEWADSAVSAIDTRTKQVVKQISVPFASGIAANRRNHRIYAGSLRDSVGALAVISGRTGSVIDFVKSRRSNADNVEVDSRRNIVYLSNETEGYVSFVSRCLWE